jgi:hypothetical protein
MWNIKITGSNDDDDMFSILYSMLYPTKIMKHMQTYILKLFKLANQIVSFLVHNLIK